MTGVILAYITYNAVYALASYSAGLLADRLRPPLVFGTGLLFFALGYIGLGLVHSHAIAWLLLGAYGLFTAATDGVGKAWISSLVPAGQRGTAQGVYQGLTGIGVLVAGRWAGLLWQSNGQLPWYFPGRSAPHRARRTDTAHSRMSPEPGGVSPRTGAGHPRPTAGRAAASFLSPCTLRRAAAGLPCRTAHDSADSLPHSPCRGQFVASSGSSSSHGSTVQPQPGTSRRPLRPGPGHCHPSNAVAMRSRSASRSSGTTSVVR